MKDQGTITALVTPFINRKLDESGLAKNIQYQISQGIDGILVLGSTGESCTLSAEEQKRVISIAVREAKNKVPVWAGTGSYCTRSTIEKTNLAKDLGADIALIVTPYYNRPTQEGIYRHYEEIANSLDMPIVVYNVPVRCGTNIEPGTLARIAQLPNVMGIKEAAGNISQTGDFIHSILQKFPHFKVFSGDDIMTFPMMALGAAGVISVVSNLIPAKIASLVNAVLQKRYEEARAIHYELLPIYKVAFIETNPIPIKAAMELCGMPAGDCRLPLSPIAADHLKIIHSVLSKMHLIK